MIKNLVLITLVFLLSQHFNRTQINKGVQYRFSDIHKQNYIIKTNFDHFFLSSKNIQEERPILVFFFQHEDKSALEYIQSLNNLQKGNKLRVIGIFFTPIEESALKQFIQSFKINFLILNPQDKKNMAQNFAAHFDFYNADLQKQINNEKVIQQNKNVKQQSPLFLLLYDRHGKLYQSYKGIVIEEMFNFDIKQMQGR